MEKAQKKSNYGFNGVCFNWGAVSSMAEDQDCLERREGPRRNEEWVTRKARWSGTQVRIHIQGERRDGEKVKKGRGGRG
jgi:hypothetical protein